MWDPPLTAGTLDSLHYRVIVVNNDTGVVIVSNTTTVTTQAVPDVQLCHYYTANVTACVCVCVCVQVFVHIFAIHLEYYRVYSSSRKVGFAVPYKVVFSVELNLKVYRYKC